MATFYSTHSVHPRDRLSYWLEVATRAFVRHDFSSSAGSSFLGTIRLGSLGNLGVSAFECNACEVVRRQRDIARDDSDDFLLCVQLGGKSVFRQDGRQAVNENGSFVLLDARRPSSATFLTQTKSLTFKIPRQGLEARLGNVSGLTAHALNVDRPEVGLASGFLSLLPGRADELDGPASAKIADQTLDLVALAFSGEAQTSSAFSSPRTIALLRLKSAIEARLGETEFKPAAAAAAAGISVRYANALLSLEGSSLERFILKRRLERCRGALEDPALDHRMIGEIAFSWGFSDLSHFGRRFKAEFGCAPGEYRAKRNNGAGSENSSDDPLPRSLTPSCE